MTSFEQSSTTVNAEDSSITSENRTASLTSSTATDGDTTTISRAGDTTTSSSFDASKAVRQRTSDTSPKPTIASSSKAKLQRPAPLKPTQSTDLGLIVPGSFIPVTIHIEDVDGQLLTEGKYLYATDNFSSVAEVNNGQAAIRLLDAEYSNFVVVGESNEEDVDYAWFSTDESNTVMPSPGMESTITVERVEIQSAGGFISLGGSGIG